ncbi:MAG: hypothetical protein LBG80_20825 [Bacteroidales bacterium]|jgi:hypothetical protein|nr:hypothetical protein [Bacteroidales bacterium]
MKRILFLLFILLSFSASLYAQFQLMFWTKNPEYGNIKMYVNDRYVGTITRAYSWAPDCGTYGCVTVNITKPHSTWSAESEDGTTWSSTPATLINGCNRLELYGTPNSEKQHKSTSGSSSGSSSKSTSGSTSGSDRGSPVTDAGGAGAAIGAAGAAVATLLVLFSSDLYITGAFSGNYGGMEFGLRNSWNKHIDIEYGASYNRLGAWGKQGDVFGSDYYNTSNTRYSYEEGNPADLWGMNLNFMFSFFKRPYVGDYGNTIYGGIEDEWNRYGRRHPVANPYIGICTHLFFHNTPFAIGPCAGVNLAAGNRVKFSFRYTFLYNFERERIAAHQVEAGFILKYQIIPFWMK